MNTAGHPPPAYRYVDEDPATGAAPTAFAGYFGALLPEREAVFTLVIEQGFEMGRPSLIQVRAQKKDGRVEGIEVGGSVWIVGEGSLSVP